MAIKVLARANKRAEILIHESIGEGWYGDGLTSKRFIKDLEALGDVDTIVVRINSPGGAVFDGIAIYNALKSHTATKEVKIEGLAASAASFIAMCGDTVTMGEGSMMMVHNPWTFAMGDADDMREAADMLDKVADSLIDIYFAKTKIDRTELKEMLDAETWMSASEAVNKGFADTKEGDDSKDADAAASARAKALDDFKRFADSCREAAAEIPLRFAAEIFKSATADATQEENDMALKPAASAAPTADNKNSQQVTEAVQAALAAEQNRTEGIRAAFGRFASANRALMDECLGDQTCTVDAARVKLLAKLGEGVEPAGPSAHVMPGADSRDKFMAGAEQVLLVRAGMAKPEAGNEFNGMGVADLAVVALRRANISVAGLTRDRIASRVFATHTTSDFPQLLSNTAGKVLRKAYGEFPHNWKKCFAKGSVSDFKVHPRIQIGSFSSLAVIPEGGEYTYGTTKEEYENAAAVTKGKAIQFTRQMLVNDDLGGFLTRAQRMGRAAARTVNSDAFSYLVSGSSAHGPTMADGGQMFNATASSATGSGHANLTSSGTAISVDSIGVGRAMMRKQKDKAMNQTLNIEPKILLCSVLKEDKANEIVRSRTKDGQSNAEVINVHQNRVEVVSDPIIDGVNNGLSWYLFADPLDVPILEVVFLEGVEEPFIDERIEFSTDALDLKVRLDYGTANGDWRGGYKNVGA